MVLRMLDYGGFILLEYCRKQRRESKTLRPPLLVPVVVSHDPGGWSAATDLEELYVLDEELRTSTQSFRPRAGYLLIDLCRWDNEAARERASDAFRHVVLVALRESRNLEILEHLAAVAESINLLAAQPDAAECFSLLTCYICHVTRNPEVTPQVVNQVLASSGAAAKGPAAASWQRLSEGLVDEGREQGRRMFSTTLLGIVEERFDSVSSQQRQRIESASMVELQRWMHACATSTPGSVAELLAL